MSSLGHTLRPDGTLKDASEMTWTFDADEALPFPSDTMSGSGITLPCLPSPARGISGVRQTTRISRLPYRFRHGLDSPSDPVQAHGVTKRKAPPSDDQDDGRRVARKTKTNEDGDTSADGTTTEVATEVATEPAEDDYESIKAMADADHQVHFPSPSFQLRSSSIQIVAYRPREERTADVRLIFRRDKGYIHPVTGKILDGHWCTVCR
jgi:hypothetical protein